MTQTYFGFWKLEFRIYLEFGIWNLEFPEPYGVLVWLEFRILKSGISLTALSQPESGLQSLPPMLRSKILNPISSCSKAPGVFSSNHRYPASSPELYFHRAPRWDSSPVVTPFVRFGTYPKRNCAQICYFVTNADHTRILTRAIGTRQLI